MRLFMANKSSLVCLLVFSVGLSGCLGQSQLQFFMLETPTALLNSVAASTLAKTTVVGLGPIHLPEYLDRPQMVVAVGDNQYQLDEQHRWAERLDQNVSRVLAQQLASHLGLEQVIRHPWPQRQVLDYQVSVDVLQFHQTAGGNSRLDAQWQIRQQEQIRLARHFNCSLPADSADPVQVVKAQSGCLAQLAGQISAGFAEIRP